MSQYVSELNSANNS